MFKKIINLVFSPVKKLKIWCQILIIIGILVFFSSIQGIVGYNIINTLNNNSTMIFDKVMHLITTFKDLQNDFMGLQTTYNNNVVQSDNSVQSLFNTVILPGITSKIDYIKRIDPKTITFMDDKLLALEKIIARPINAVNSKELDKIVFDINNTLKSQCDSVLTSTYKIMWDEKNFSNFATSLTLILLVAGSILSILIGFYITHLIVHPLKSIKTAANALAIGDFTKDISAEGSIEIASVVDDLNKAINCLRELVKGINQDSNMLYLASQELKNASGETGKSATEVAKTMEELARGTSEQAGQTNEAVDSIDALADLVREVSNEVETIASESVNVANSAKLGQKATKDVTAEIVKIYNTTKDVTRIIEELNQSSVEISSITVVIQNIAEQTTLLALNAAIEAARAGEYGRGFGVVAMETGKLAEQTKQAAEHIGNLIAKMRQRSTHVVQSMDDGMKVVESGKNLAANASVTFENIFNKLDYIVNRIDLVAVSAQKMADKNENMIGIISNIAALSEETMAGTQEVSAAAEEQSASVEEVSALAENLAALSNKLRQAVAQFQIVPYSVSLSCPNAKKTEKVAR
jgi:methyl-accepting chemotaxis protein